MLEKELVRSGYKSYPVGHLESSWAKKFYQKKFSDLTGTKYFISVYISKGIPNALFLDGKGSAKVQFSLSEKLHLSKGCNTVNIELFDVDDVLFMEDFYEDIWQKLDFEYYD